MEKAKWGAQKTARVLDVMRADYMSSEESEVDEITKKIVRYNVRRLPWESPSLRRAKKKLDRLHMSSLSELVQSRIVSREDGQPSIRPKPKDCPEWAAKNEDDNVLDESAQSLSPSDSSLNDSVNDILNDSI